MERRLDQAALAHMKTAFAGQQAIAQQHPGALQHAALGEVALIGNQDVANEVRMIYEIDVLIGEPEIGQVAILPCNSWEELNGLRAEGRQIAYYWKISGTSRFLRRQLHCITSQAGWFSES